MKTTNGETRKILNWVYVMAIAGDHLRSFTPKQGQTRLKTICDNCTYHDYTATLASKSPLVLFPHSLHCSNMTTVLSQTLMPPPAIIQDKLAPDSVSPDTPHRTFKFTASAALISTKNKSQVNVKTSSTNEIAILNVPVCDNAIVGENVQLDNPKLALVRGNDIGLNFSIDERENQRITYVYFVKYLFYFYIKLTINNFKLLEYINHLKVTSIKYGSTMKSLV